MRKLKIAGIVLVGLLLFVVAIPVGIIAVQGESLAQMFVPKFENTSKRLMIAEAVRPYVLPVDSGITPMRAGELRHSLRADKDRATFRDFAFRNDVPAVVPRWNETPFDTTLFPGLRQVSWNGPDVEKVLEFAVARPTPAQRAYLNAIAADPVWRVFDQVGSAAAVDVLGGEFEIPFSTDAMWYDMPIPKFTPLKELAYASVTRAAAHLAAQRPDSAEHALRSVISFGFALSDNAPSLIEQLIGVVIVGIGRDGLERFFAIRDDPRGSLLAARVDSLTKLSEAGGEAPLLRGLAVEWALGATFSPCTNVKELIFGRSAENQALLDSYRAAFARYPSEHAFFDMFERNFSEGPVRLMREAASEGPVVGRALDLASGVAGKITGNPRLLPCTVMARVSW